MQISTPTQAISSNVSNAADENIQKSNSTGLFADTPALWGSRQKKVKPGIFARLLEGLVSKTKVGALEPNSGADETSEFQSAGKIKKSTLKETRSKKAFNFIDERRIVQDLSLTSSSPFFRQRGLQSEQGLKQKAGSGELNPFRKEEGLQKLNLDWMEEGGKGLAAGKESGRRNTAMNRAEASLLFPGRLGAGKAETENLFSVSFRDMEAQFKAAQAFVNQTRNNAEKEGNKLSELRGKKGRLNIEVRDQRSGFEQVEAAGETNKWQMFGAAKSVNTEIEIPVNLSLYGDKGNGDLSAKNGKESASGRSFEDALARELRSGLSTDIVRDASIIVRDGGEGTIRLALRPASLGNVKIRLEMAENKITGHIIVESSEALRAFERELPVLEKAFKDSGFSETNLQMSLAQDGWNFSPGGGRQEGDFQSLPPVLAASRYEAETEWVEEPPIMGGFAFSAAAGRTPVNLLV